MENIDSLAKEVEIELTPPVLCTRLHVSDTAMNSHTFTVEPDVVKIELKNLCKHCVCVCVRACALLHSIQKKRPVVLKRINGFLLRTLTETNWLQCPRDNNVSTPPPSDTTTAGIAGRDIDIYITHVLRLRCTNDNDCYFLFSAVTAGQIIYVLLNFLKLNKKYIFRPHIKT